MACVGRAVSDIGGRSRGARPRRPSTTARHPRTRRAPGPPRSSSQAVAVARHAERPFTSRWRSRRRVVGAALARGRRSGHRAGFTTRAGSPPSGTLARTPPRAPQAAHGAAVATRPVAARGDAAAAARAGHEAFQRRGGEAAIRATPATTAPETGAFVRGDETTRIAAVERAGTGRDRAGGAPVAQSPLRAASRGAAPRVRWARAARPATIERDQAPDLPLAQERRQRGCWRAKPSRTIRLPASRSPVDRSRGSHELIEDPLLVGIESHRCPSPRVGDHPNA